MYSVTGSSPDGSSRGVQPRKRITAPTLRDRKGGDAIAMVTAYDFTMARLLDEAGVDVLLVGDSLGMVVQGADTTIPVTLDDEEVSPRALERALEIQTKLGNASEVKRLENQLRSKYPEYFQKKRAANP